LTVVPRHNLAAAHSPR